MKSKLYYGAIAGFIVALSSCGGGSSSSSKDASSVSSTASLLSSSLASSTSSMAISSSISSTQNSSANTSSSSISSVASNKISALVSGTVYLKDSNNDAVSLDDPATVAISVSLLDSNDNVITINSPKVLSALSNTQSGAPFTAEISGTNAKTIVVNVSKAGFTDYARRFNISPTVNLTATLNETQTLTIAKTDITSISGKTLTGFNVAVINSDGNQQIVSGNAGKIADLSVSIPQSMLPQGTTNVDVKMQAFNPNNPKEAESFPGAYQDSTGNKLLSVAFNYADMQTNTGVSLQKIAQNTRNARLLAQKQAGKAISPVQFAKQSAQKTGAAIDPVIINRRIPLESCLSLSQLGDANADQNGFQVPVYTYNPNSGLWDLLGYGTLFDDANNLVAANQTVFDCKLHTYVLEIEATNEIFLSKWWNLDYPLVFKKPIKLCATIELRDEGNKPVAGNLLYLHDDDDIRSFSSESFVSDVNGRVNIEVMSLDSGTDLTAIANIYNPSFYSAYTPVPIQLSTACNSDTPPVVVPISVPATCKVSGLVTDKSGAPLVNRYMIAGDFVDQTGESLVMPVFASSDATGHYEFSLQCKQRYEVIEWYSALTTGLNFDKNFAVNVNNQVDLSEASDNGSTAVLKDMAVDTGKPTAFVSTDENQAKMSMFVLYGGDSFPLSYNFTLTDSVSNKVVGQYSGNVNKSDMLSDLGPDGIALPYGQILIDHKLPAVTDIVYYLVTGEIVDAKGNKSEIFGTVYQMPATQ